MSGSQLDLLTHAVPPRVEAVLALVLGDLIHQRDREAVVEAILTAADENDGEVDPNVVRPLIPEWVYPRCIGATYWSLARAGVIEPAGWTVSQDTKGSNSGRPARLWRLTGGSA